MTRILLIPLLGFLAACASAGAGRSENAPPAPAAPAGTVPVAAETAAPESLENLSIEAAVGVALRRNADLAVAAARIEAAAAAVEEAKSAFQPTLSVSLGYTHTNDPVLVFMEALRNRELSMSGDFNQPGDRGNARASLKAGWLVWDSGRREAGEDLAKISVRLTEADRDAITNGIRAAVIETGLMHAQAEEGIRVAQDSVELVSEQLRIARARFDSGAAQRSDVLSVEVRLAAARESLVRAKNARERALAALRTLLGVTADEPFSLAPGGFDVPPVPDGDPMQLARANRPELRRADEAVLAAKRAVDLAGMGDDATLTAFGSYDLDDRYFGFTPKQDSATAGLELEVPIFDGGRTAARVAKAKANVRVAEAARRKAELGVEAEVTRARLDLAEAKERLAVSAKSEEQAEEALSLIRARYESGAATITESLDAEVALTGARVRNVAARFDVARATAELRRALGICGGDQR